MAFANINSDTNLSALVPCASAKLDQKTTNIFSCTVLVTVIIAETYLTVSLILLTKILETFPQQTFVIYYYIVVPVSPLTLIISKLSQQYPYSNQPHVSSRFRQTKLLSPPATLFTVHIFIFVAYVHCLLFSPNM